MPARGASTRRYDHGNDTQSIRKWAVLILLLTVTDLTFALQPSSNASQLHYEGGCSSYNYCNDCVNNKYCAFCLIQHSAITGSKCFSIADILSEKDPCPTLVFSSSWTDLDSKDSNWTSVTSSKPLTCQQSLEALPQAYDAPSIPKNQFIAEINWPQMGQAVAKNTTIVFNINGDSIYNTEALNVLENENIQVCYNVSNYIDGIFFDDDTCTSFSSVRNLFIDLSSHVGVYSIWYWIIYKDSGEIIQPPMILLVTRWPARLLEAAVYLSTKESLWFPKELVMADNMVDTNGRFKPNEKFMNKFVFHENEIPKIIHQIWTGGEEELRQFQQNLAPTDKRHHFLKWSKTWPALHPEWKYFLWDLQSMRNFVAKNYQPFLDDYDSFDMDIKRTDFFRILILFHVGGVYIDIDFEALQPMDELLSANKFDIYLAEHETDYQRDGVKGEWPNAWMASIRFHPLWWLMLTEYIRRKNLQPHGYVTDITGPHAFTEVVQFYIEKFSTTQLYSYKPIHFYPVQPLNKTSMRLDALCIASDSCREMYPHSVATHHYAATWMPLVDGNVEFITNFEIAYEYYDAVAKDALAGKASDNDDDQGVSGTAEVVYDSVVKYIRAAYSHCTRCRIPYFEDSPISKRLHTILEKPDRKYMKNVLLPAIIGSRRNVPTKILSVGVALYTLQYEYEIKSMFSNGSLVEYVTLEIDPKQKLYGSTDRHVVGDATKLLDYFDEESIDILILNGVLGWGGEKKYQTAQEVTENDLTLHMMVSADKILKQDGILLLGRNSRHYSPTLSKIIPLFYPISFPKHQVPSRRSFWYNHQSDHFYDILKKSNIHSHKSRLASGRNLHLFNDNLGTTNYEILKNTMCDINHLIVVNRAADALLFAGKTILKTSGRYNYLFLK